MNGKSLLIGGLIVGDGSARLHVLGQPAQHGIQGARRRNKEELRSTVRSKAFSAE